MRTSIQKISIGLALITAALTAHAGVIFSFSQVDGNVVMTSSGVLDTTKLVPTSPWSWGGTGIEENGHYDIIGGTDSGYLDVSFGFHQGTDFSPWASATGPWSSSDYAAAATGSKPFATYIWDGGIQIPGIDLRSSDIINGLWTPDQSWTFVGASFASLGMNVGTYTVTDALTGEWLSFRINSTNDVPEPGTLLLLGLAASGLAMLRRSRKA